MKTMKKTILTIVCTILVCTCVMGTTLAYLVDKTDPIKNTFTVGDINIELKETKGEGTDYAKSFKMIPGSTIAKDPTITVKAGSEKCYLFVEIIESSNFDDFMTYEVELGALPTEGWTEFKKSNADGTISTVYYWVINEDTEEDTPYEILKGNVVTVKSSVTKEMGKEIRDDLTKVPTLTFIAYAVQYTALTVDQAWTVAQTGSLPTP